MPRKTKVEELQERLAAAKAELDAFKADAAKMAEIARVRTNYEKATQAYEEARKGIDRQEDAFLHERRLIDARGGIPVELRDAIHAKLGLSETDSKLLNRSKYAGPPCDKVWWQLKQRALAHPPPALVQARKDAARLRNARDERYSECSRATRPLDNLTRSVEDLENALRTAEVAEADRAQAKMEEKSPTPIAVASKERAAKIKEGRRILAGLLDGSIKLEGYE